MDFYICYIDEAGCPGRLPSAISNIQPLLVIGGLFIEQSMLSYVTKEFIAIKTKFFPKSLSSARHYLERNAIEIKGSELRKAIRVGNRRQRRHAIGFLNSLISLIERCQIKICYRVWIKPIGGYFNGQSVYTSSIQAISGYFNHFLSDKSSKGLVVLDSRLTSQNYLVSISVFTQKHQTAGDLYPHLVEMPVFGNSKNHTCIQISDIIASALLFPIAAHTYCLGKMNNIHADPTYKIIKDQYIHRLQNLQYRYQDDSGKWQGGIVVSDGIEGRSGKLLFMK